MKNTTSIKELVEFIEEVGLKNIDAVVIFERDKYNVGDRVSIGKYDIEVKNKEYKIKVL